MINIDCNFESRVLNSRTELKVILPQKIDYMNVTDDFEEFYRFENIKTLLLLHGAWDDGKSWINNTCLPRYADENNIAVILPSIGNNFYIKKRTGEDYFRLVTEEILGFARSMFPLSKRREDTFVGGNSMGGYGAMKMAFERPDLFSKAFSLSGALDIQESARLLKGIGLNMDSLFENVRKLNGTKEDLMAIMEETKMSGKEIPDIYQAVGEKDYMYKGNLKFKDRAKELGIKIKYEESTGEHDWKFWNEYIEKAILWCLK